ncbi:MAG: HIT domain-containing protein [Candidatus Omnitrophica bacterium]|nr:HIT domain-containing protein [Candidatus Omnitrophota bacterium]
MTGRLWAPWRVGYILSTRRASKGCLFCRLKRPGQDRKLHVLSRGKRAFSVLNRFPYNNGHLLVAPFRHVGRLDALEAEEWSELFSLACDAIARMQKALSPHGYNVGINLGRASGAGIPGHLHLHVVPRWMGDTNFMPVLAQTKVVSQSLDEAFRLLKRVKPTKAVAFRHGRKISR